MRTFLFLLLSLVTPAAAQAGSGNFDTVFNGTGVRFVEFSPLVNPYLLHDVNMAFDAQGRMAVVLQNGNGGNPALGIARVLCNGSLDTDFGDLGHNPDSDAADSATDLRHRRRAVACATVAPLPTPGFPHGLH